MYDGAQDSLTLVPTTDSIVWINYVLIVSATVIPFQGNQWFTLWKEAVDADAPVTLIDWVSSPLSQDYSDRYPSGPSSVSLCLFVSSQAVVMKQGSYSLGATWGTQMGRSYEAKLGNLGKASNFLFHIHLCLFFKCWRTFSIDLDVDGRSSFSVWPLWKLNYCIHIYSLLPYRYFVSFQNFGCR